MQDNMDADLQFDPRTPLEKRHVLIGTCPIRLAKDAQVQALVTPQSYGE
jgi:hypothetical protein